MILLWRSSAQAPIPLRVRATWSVVPMGVMCNCPNSEVRTDGVVKGLEGGFGGGDGDEFYFAPKEACHWKGSSRPFLPFKSGKYVLIFLPDLYKVMILVLPSCLEQGWGMSAALTTSACSSRTTSLPWRPHLKKGFWHSAQTGLLCSLLSHLSWLLASATSMALLVLLQRKLNRKAILRRRQECCHAPRLWDLLEKSCYAQIKYVRESIRG